MGDWVDVKAAYWFVSAKGNFKTRPQKPAPLDEMLEPFSDAVGTITDGIGKGLFPANPGKDGANCRYCDFKNLCPTRPRADLGEKASGRTFGDLRGNGRGRGERMTDPADRPARDAIVERLDENMGRGGGSRHRQDAEPCRPRRSSHNNGAG